MTGDLSTADIDDLLRAQPFGRIGCHSDGLTYVVPVNYVYQNGDIYGQTGEGMKVRMLRANPNVCFEVDQVEAVGSWRSVIVWGRYEELDGDEADAALRALVAKLVRVAGVEQRVGTYGLLGSRIRAAYTRDRNSIIYRIRASKKTGRFERR
jgi:nitroimidazol reductase NimA-like FMN-containing flavoprotein (pyridoxamine 5'-phosphate oxidase superfamily)